MAIGFRLEKCDQECTQNQGATQLRISRGGPTPETIVIPQDETAIAAQILFADFYRRAFTNQGVEPPEESQLTVQREYEEFAIQMMATVGQDLRRIAEQIEASREREIIRRRAANVNIRISSFERFSAILRELFPNGQITREGIVVLFFFCSDIAFRAYSCGSLANLHQLIGWTLQFIFDHICSWVQAQGGWDKVIRGFVQGTAVTVCAILGSVAFAMYIRRNL